MLLIGWEKNEEKRIIKRPYHKRWEDASTALSRASEVEKLKGMPFEEEVKLVIGKFTAITHLPELIQHKHRGHPEHLNL